MKNTVNYAKAAFPAVSQNEALARVLVTGFLIPLGVNPETLADIKTCVSEAVTNAVVHAYRGTEEKGVVLEMKAYDDDTLTVRVSDKGKGIADIEKAMEPFYTTDREGERSGMGLPIMQSFSEKLTILSSPKGTRVTMKMRLK